MENEQKTAWDLTRAHQWTNGREEVLILRCCNKDGTSYGGFQWPMTVGATVNAPDWNPAPECGGGLHGWPWGIAMGDGKEPDYGGAWIVFGAVPADVVSIGGKCKAKTGIVRFVGTWDKANAFVLAGQMELVYQSSRGAASATGDSGAASATGTSGAASATGYRGAASATGYSGAASATGTSGAASATGTSGAASATGYSGAASATGDSGAASATGYRGAASATGTSSVASVTGTNGLAQSGEFGCICLAWWNDAESRQEMRCARTGLGYLKPHTWYRLDAQGEFVEDEGR